jgi:hypothetical protein
MVRIALKLSTCDCEINAMVEGSSFGESHVLKILSWRAKEGGIPIDSGLIFPFAGSVLVCGREQVLL